MASPPARPHLSDPDLDLSLSPDSSLAHPVATSPFKSVFAARAEDVTSRLANYYPALLFTCERFLPRPVYDELIHETNAYSATEQLLLRTGTNPQFYQHLREYCSDSEREDLRSLLCTPDAASPPDGGMGGDISFAEAFNQGSPLSPGSATASPPGSPLSANTGLRPEQLTRPSIWGGSARHQSEIPACCSSPLGIPGVSASPTSVPLPPLLDSGPSYPSTGTRLSESAPNPHLYMSYGSSPSEPPEFDNLPYAQRNLRWGFRERPYTPGETIVVRLALGRAFRLQMLVLQFVGKMQTEAANGSGRTLGFLEQSYSLVGAPPHAIRHLPSPMLVPQHYECHVVVPTSTNCSQSCRGGGLPRGPGGHPLPGSCLEREISVSYKISVVAKPSGLGRKIESSQPVDIKGPNRAETVALIRRKTPPPVSHALGLEQTQLKNGVKVVAKLRWDSPTTLEDSQHLAIAFFVGLETVGSSRPPDLSGAEVALELCRGHVEDHSEGGRRRSYRARNERISSASFPGRFQWDAGRGCWMMRGHYQVLKHEVTPLITCLVQRTFTINATVQHPAFVRSVAFSSTVAELDP